MTKEVIKDKKSILVVDDTVSFNNFISKLLKTEGFIITSAYNSDTAIARIKSKPIDLIITDINLPGKDGIEFIRLVKKIKPQMKFIVMTGFPHIDNQKEAFNEGVNAYIVKPFTNERFLMIVKRSLNNNKSSHVMLDNSIIKVNELLKSYREKKKTIIIEIITKNKNGRLYIKNGEVIHAVAGSLIGKDAYINIQKWKAEIINLISYDGDGIQTIDIIP